MQVLCARWRAAPLCEHNPRKSYVNESVRSLGGEEERSWRGRRHIGSSQQAAGAAQGHASVFFSCVPQLWRSVENRSPVHNNIGRGPLGQRRTAHSVHPPEGLGHQDGSCTFTPKLRVGSVVQQQQRSGCTHTSRKHTVDCAQDQCCT